MRISRRLVVLIALGAVVALPVAGLLFQTLAEARDARRFPSPGSLVDIGGRRLHLICEGQGSPTVIFEPSGMGSALSAERARAEIAAHTKVCSYDRMGMGWSDPGPSVVSAGRLADDLLLLYNRAALAPPFVIVAASIGGLTAEMFARRHPERVAGLVFLDAATSGFISRARPYFSLTRAGACVTSVAARLGLIRLMDPLRLRGVADAGERAVAITYRAGPWSTLCAVVRGIPATEQEFLRTPALPPDLPLAVLSAETTDGLLPPGWESQAAGFKPLLREAHKALAGRSTRGTWRIVAGSGHLIGNTQPHAVAEAVLELVAQIRGG